MVEIFFSIITRQVIRRGSYASISELHEAMDTYIAGWNERAHPFTWMKNADELVNHAHSPSTSFTSAGRAGLGTQAAPIPAPTSPAGAATGLPDRVNYPGQYSGSAELVGRCVRGRSCAPHVKRLRGIASVIPLLGPDAAWLTGQNLRT